MKRSFKAALTRLETVAAAGRDLTDGTGTVLLHIRIWSFYLLHAPTLYRG